MLLRHPFRAMPQQGMRDFVAHHDRERVGILRHRKQPGVDRDLAAGQAECVDLVGLQHADVPVERAPVDRRLQPFLGGELGCYFRRDRF